MNNKLREQYCLERGGINPSNIIEWYYIEWLESKLSTTPQTDDRDKELIECECGHTVPIKFAVTDGEYWTCMPCQIEYISGKLEVKPIAINQHFEILKSTLNDLVKFIDESEKTDFILDVCNKYKEELSQLFHEAQTNEEYLQNR